jgi:phenylalanyl-tRNA synthetase beta chain
VKLSYNWLCDFVDVSGLSPQEVADKLTMGAMEVEEVRPFGPDLEGEVVVGEIVEINPHPNADKIRLTKIRFVENSNDVREIVCGAWNIEVGNRIPVALPGSRVISRHDGTALEIKESKIRGFTSNGMLCSAPELGIAGSGEGILILPADTPLGVDAKELLHLTRDWILHVGSRSNRGDALCVIGLAREVAALFGRPLKQPQWSLPAEEDLGQEVKVEIENTEDCPYFTARHITQLRNGPSPALIERRLQAVGVRTVSAIVDITNYVMLEYGQPLHAYDMRQLRGPVLATRRARQGEKLTTIDANERALTDEMMVIADAGGVVGVAGVMGGKDSEIADDTFEIALEAACFKPARVRRSSRLLGLSSDSSLRFERGVDLGSVRSASDRATYLLIKYAGGKSGKLTRAGSDSVTPQTVSMRMSQLQRITDIEIGAQEVVQLLMPLGFKGQVRGEDGVDVQVPSFRQKDVTREIDVIEEVCRLWGYDRLPAAMPDHTIAAAPPAQAPLKARESLRASGLSEAWLSSLISNEDLTGRGNLVVDRSRPVLVLNPLSEEHQVLRLSLLPGLARATAYNQARGRQDVWLFEVGRNYQTQRAGAKPADYKQTATVETTLIGGILSGTPQHHAWQSEREADFYTAKGVVENLLDDCRLDCAKIRFETGEVSGWFHPNKSCRIQYRQGDATLLLGSVGELHPSVIKAYELKKPAFAFEVDLDKISALSRSHSFSEIYATPQVVRDLSADLDHHVGNQAVMACIDDATSSLLRKVEMVSTFQLSEDKKSLTYRLTFQHATETLTAEQVEGEMKTVREELSARLGATFRT